MNSGNKTLANAETDQQDQRVELLNVLADALSLDHGYGARHSADQMREQLHSAVNEMSSEDASALLAALKAEMGRTHLPEALKRVEDHCPERSAE
jgi:hypothetical protein